MARTRQDGWQVSFTIPAFRWSALGAWESEEQRAKKRAWFRRRLGAQTFREAKTAKQVWKVNRFVLLVGVCAPFGNTTQPPLYACEVVKPLVDAGTDAKLWTDDDAEHRVNTTYFAMRDQWHDGQYHILFIVLPVGAQFNTDTQIRNWYHAQHVASHTVQFSIPHRLWLTSNFNDTDLLARQKGVNVYGSEKRFMGGVSPENRKALRGNLMAFAMQRWAEYRNVTMNGDYSVSASVAYPSTQASDPDNASETISCLLAAGVVRKQLPSMTGTCGEVSIVKAPYRCPASFHVVKLELFPRTVNLSAVISSLVKAKGFPQN